MRALTMQPHETVVQLPLDARAPGAARLVVGGCLRGHVAPGVLAMAQLLVTELVTNSLVHGGALDGETVSVRVALGSEVVHLEVADPGRGYHEAPSDVGGRPGHGFGLRLVSALSERWGLEHIADGETRAWAQLRRAPTLAAA
jgi:anti-sigma regulatory factor (Ser/Thr protein kinase)